jgi:hypothetical protein
MSQTALVRALNFLYQYVCQQCPLAIEEVAPTVRQHQPNVLFSASMWDAEEAARIRSIAENERPGIRTHAIPQGLQVEKGPDAVVEYLVEVVPGLLDSP